jgi:hypothetical protein
VDCKQPVPFVIRHTDQRVEGRHDAAGGSLLTLALGQRRDACDVGGARRAGVVDEHG